VYEALGLNQGLGLGFMEVYGGTGSRMKALAPLMRSFSHAIVQLVSFQTPGWEIWIPSVWSQFFYFFSFLMLIVLQ